VWDVTATGLKPNASKLVFSGNGILRCAMSSDGKYLAIGEGDGKVSIYDFPGSLDAGGSMLAWTLPATSLSITPDSAIPRHFTTDGKDLVVVYPAYDTKDPNFVVVWDLTSQTIVRSVNYPHDDYPYAALPGDYAGAMWIASSRTDWGDAGTEDLVTLMDVSKVSPTKAQVVLPGTVDILAFTPDGAGLLVGMDTSEITLWDISDKTKIVKPAASLLPPTSGYYTGVDSIAVANGGSHLAAGLQGNDRTMVKIASLTEQKSVEKITQYRVSALAFAPGNTGLAIGELYDGVLLYCTP
jgi:WD40 repeat protein